MPPVACTDGPAAATSVPGAWELTAGLAYFELDSPNLASGPNDLPIGNRTTAVTLR